MHPAHDKGVAFNHCTLKHVCQRQVRQHAVFLTIFDHTAHVLRHRVFGRGGNALKAVHHALGLAGGARGVNQHGQVGACALRETGNRRGARRNRVPGVVRGGRCQGKGNARHVLGHARNLLGPGVELADKQQAGLAVFEHKAHVGRRLGREDGHRGVARHPDSQFGHKEVRAVLGQDADACARRKAIALQVRGHAPRLVHGLAPGVVGHLAFAQGLGQKDRIGDLLFVFVDVVQHQLGACHERVSLEFMLCASVQSAG